MSDDLADDLLEALSNFKIVMELQNKDFNADKLRQYEEVRKEIVKINECYVEYFGSVYLTLSRSDMNDEKEIRFLSALMFHPHFFFFRFFFLCFDFLNRMFGFTISE